MNTIPSGIDGIKLTVVDTAIVNGPFNHLTIEQMLVMVSGPVVANVGLLPLKRMLPFIVERGTIEWLNLLISADLDLSNAMILGALNNSVQVRDAIAANVLKRRGMTAKDKAVFCFNKLLGDAMYDTQLDLHTRFRTALWLSELTEVSLNDYLYTTAVDSAAANILTDDDMSRLLVASPNAFEGAAMLLQDH